MQRAVGYRVLPRPHPDMGKGASTAVFGFVASTEPSPRSRDLVYLNFGI